MFKRIASKNNFTKYIKPADNADRDITEKSDYGQFVEIDKDLTLSTSNISDGVTEKRFCYNFIF